MHVLGQVPPRHPNHTPPCLWWQVVAAEGTLAQVAAVGLHEDAKPPEAVDAAVRVITRLREQTQARVWEALPGIWSPRLLPAAGLKPARILLQCQAGCPDRFNVLKILLARGGVLQHSQRVLARSSNAAFALVLHMSPQ